ncbi:MAG: helix-turn-helix domain-containing protein [Gammaproteobacteria bacterium]|nr:helix-turn-helix domain-containing protein [Gammaproteobacteria bacterium]
MPDRNAPAANISKSVRRAFQVLELFASRREPLNAAEIRRELDIPQPSLRALLKNLHELGYLNYDVTSRTFIPNNSLTALGTWIPDRLSPAPAVCDAIDRIAAKTGETASLSGRRGTRLHVLYARVAEHPVAVQLRPGVGELLPRSAAGRCLMAALPAPQLDLLVEQLRAELRGAERADLKRIPGILSRIRTNRGYHANDLLLQGVGAVCVMTAVADEPAVVAIAGIKDRLRGREKAIDRVIRRTLKTAGLPVGTAVA